MSSSLSYLRHPEISSSVSLHRWRWPPGWTLFRTASLRTWGVRLWPERCPAAPPAGRAWELQLYTWGRRWEWKFEVLKMFLRGPSWFERWSNVSSAWSFIGVHGARAVCVSVRWTVIAGQRPFGKQSASIINLCTSIWRWCRMKRPNLITPDLFVVIHTV